MSDSTPAGDGVDLDKPAAPAGQDSSAALAARSQRRSGNRTALRLAEQYGLVAVLVIAFVVFTLLLPDIFFTTGNFKAMINSQAIILLLALALTLPLRAGDFDLSVAGLMVASGAITAVMTTSGQPLIVAILASLGLGLVFGVINGFLVVKLGINSFIVTLGMSTAATGLAHAITDSKIIPNIPDTVLAIARTDILGLPSIVWIGWVLAIVFWFLYERTPLGRYLLFIGGSQNSARLAGLKVERLRMGTFVACSLIAAFAGVLLAGKVGQLNPSSAPQYLMQPFAAVFLGATTITVGRFNAIGTVVALYLLTIFVTGLQLLGAPLWVSDLFNGIALVLAVTFARLAARMNARA